VIVTSVSAFSTKTSAMFNVISSAIGGAIGG